MAESILVTGKKISSMELVTNVTGNEKIPTGQPDDLALTPNQIADHTITRGDLASHEDLSQVEVDLTTQIATLAGDVASEEAARVAGDDALQAAIDAEVSARIAADDLKVDKEGSVSSVAGRVGDVSLAPSDVLVEGFGSQEDVNKYVPKPFLSGYAYGLGERVVLANGDIVKSTVDGNTNDPNVAMVGWILTRDASFIIDGTQTQKQINARADFINAINYLTESEINDLAKANPVLDHTKSLQKAIDASVMQGKKCFIPRMFGAYNIKIEPDAWTALPNDKPASGFPAFNYRAGLILNSGCHLVFGANTQLKAIATDCWSGTGIIVVGDNVTIEGNNSLFLGERLTHNYTSVKIPPTKPTAEWVTGLVITGHDVVVTGMQFKDWTGDCIGIYTSRHLRNNDPTGATEIEGGFTYPNGGMVHITRNITIKNCTVDGARRNNISVTDCDGFLIDNCSILNAGYTDSNGTLGTNPKLGIDLEPYKTGDSNDESDLSEVVQNGTVSNCRFVENRAGDCTAYNTYNVKIVNNHSTGGFSYGYSQNTVISNNVIDMSIPRTNHIDSTVAFTGVSSLGGSYTDRFNHVNNSIVANNVFYGCITAVDVRGTSANIVGNMIVKCSTGIMLFNASDASIKNNFIYQTTDMPISIRTNRASATSVVDITNNSIIYKDDSTAKYPTMSFAVGIEAITETSVNMSNNVISQATKGVTCGGSYTLNMSGNLFDNISGAVLVTKQPTSLAVLSNNSFVKSHNVNRVISVGSRATIKDNYFGDCSSSMFMSISGANSRIINNIFEYSDTTKSGGYAVYVESSATNSSFIGNKFYSITQYKFGIDIAAHLTNGALIADNHILSSISVGNNTSKNNTIAGKVYSANVTYDPPSLANGVQQSTAVTLSGASLGDNVNVSFDKPLSGTRMWGEVTSANTVTVYHRNDTGAVVDVPSGTLTVKIV